MFVVDWGLVADWLTAVASLGTLFVAAVALNRWRAQARGAVAHEIKTAAWALRYAFYGARSPMIWAWEFPEEYHRARGDRRSNDVIAQSHQHVYNGRWQEVWPYVKAMAELRAKAGALFGDDAAEAAEKLARIARELQHYMREHVELLRAGPEGIKLWDQAYVQRVKDSIVVDSEKKDDRFSKEFEAAFAKVLDLLKAHS